LIVAQQKAGLLRQFLAGQCLKKLHPAGMILPGAIVTGSFYAIARLQSGTLCWRRAGAVFARMGEMGEPFAQLLISNAKSGCSDTSAFCYVVLKQDLRS
jgi:hypothetical protein